MNVKLTIARKLNSPYIRDVMKRRGWSVEYMRVLLVDFVVSTYDISLYDFLEGQP